MAILEASLRILLIALVAYVATRALRFGLGKLEQVLLTWREREDKERIANEKRVKTLTGMLRTICLTLIWVIGIVMSLDQIGLDITPILAGAGIVGLAVGFGAQNLVRDIINGFFMILENQIRVGDVAVVNSYQFSYDYPSRFIRHRAHLPQWDGHHISKHDERVVRLRYGNRRSV
jgi:small conductance mechanosensitive channel